MATSENTVIYRIVVDSSKAVDGSSAATRALANLEKSAGSMDTTLARMEKGLASLGGYMRATFALYVAEAGARLLEMGKASLEAAANLDELAEQLGTNARALQGMQFAAVQSGVKLEQLETGLSKFSQKMGEAANGSKEMIETLEQLGIKNLDLNGKLRSNEALLQDTARAILSIEDPALRSAAAVDLFGKTGTRMLPLLADIAKGTDGMSAAADRYGAMVTDHTIKRLDALADAMERNKLKMRATLANGFVDLLDEAERKAAKYLNMDFSEAGWKKGAEAQKRWWDTFTRFLEDKSDDIATIMQKISRDLEIQVPGVNIPWLGLPGAAVAGSLKMPALPVDYAAARERQRMLDRQASYVDDEAAARRGPLGLVEPGGAGRSTIKGAGEDVAERIAKLRRDTTRELQAAQEEAAASGAGARAVADLENHYKALKSAQDAYGKTADANKDAVAKLTAEIEKQVAATEKLKNLKSFNLETEALEKSNVLLEAENRLINATAEVRAREIAMIKLKQEVEAKGLTDGNEEQRQAIARRGEAIEQNERLKAQGEELKKANELWTAPLKGALESIQRSTADMWEKMLEGGTFTMKEFGDLIKTTMRRAAAEILALATIRPVIGVALQGLGAMGMVSPATMSSMGYGSYAGGGAGLMPGSGPAAAAGNSGGLGGLFGGGGGGGLFGFLGNQITPGTPLPEGVHGPVQAGALGGLTWGQGLAGVASIGMGAYGLATSRSTMGRLGGAAGIIGGGMGLLSSAGMIGSAFGPIGMGIGLLGSILPMLFGGGDAPPIPPQPDLNLGVGSFLPGGRGFTSSGYGMNGGGSLADTAGGLGTAVSRLFRSAGVRGVAGSMIGGRIWSGVDHTFNAQSRGWDDRPYTQAGLVTPGGGQEMVTYNDSSRNLQQAADLLIAAVFKANVLRGGVSGASDALKAGVTSYDPKTSQEVQNVVALAAAYDKLGKAANPARDSIDAIAASFDDLRDFAEKAGLSLEPINAEMAKRSTRVAQDFIDGMFDPLAVQLRALQDQRDSALASAQYIRDNVEGVFVDMARVAEYYTRQEANLREQFYASQISSLQSLISRLTYGDLANASPTTNLAGTGAAYRAALAQARAGDANAINNLSGYAENYITSARGNFASSPEYQAIVAEVRAALQEQADALSGGGTGSAAAANSNAAGNATLQQTAMLQDMVATQSAQITALLTRVGDLTEQVRRYAVNRAA